VLAPGGASQSFHDTETTGCSGHDVSNVVDKWKVSVKGHTKDLGCLAELDQIVIEEYLRLGFRLVRVRSKQKYLGFFWSNFEVLVLRTLGNTWKVLGKCGWEGWNIWGGLPTAKSSAYTSSTASGWGNFGKSETKWL
jgi:hypothetical protein